MTARPSAGLLAQVACLLEATARKPGNVHREADFADTTWLDFALSAAAISGPLDHAATQPLGPTIAAAVAATRQVVTSNTNLGIILLLAPLAAVPFKQPLRSGLVRVLDQTTVADAGHLYRAIRQAQPGGLGLAPEGQDVADEPTVSLVAAMQLAADRDRVARQYTTGFTDVFDQVVPLIAAGLARPDWTLETVIIAAYIAFLADHPDTLIVRKCGMDVARQASARAALVVQAGWPDRPGSDRERVSLDAWLRGDGHARNPGTTADLIAAGLFVALREGIIQGPIATRWPISGSGIMT